VNIDDFISTGSSRKTFKGAIAPRVGFSYDVAGDRSHVIFGGWGRSYSRTMANHALDERQKNAGRRRDLADQERLQDALRRPIHRRPAPGGGQWNAEVALSHVNAEEPVHLVRRQPRPQRRLRHPEPDRPAVGRAERLRHADPGRLRRRDQDQLAVCQAGEALHPQQRLGGHFAYTYSDAKTTSKEWNNDIFDWTYGRPGVRGWNPSTWWTSTAWSPRA
jgi:hypothetical protein